MNATEKELFNEKIAGIHALINSHSDMMHVELNDIKKRIGEVHSETKRTNGRVTNLETELSVSRFMQSHPKVFALIVLLFLAVLKIDVIIEFIAKIL